VRESLHVTEAGVQLTESAVITPPRSDGGELGDRLRAIRLARRLTLRDVASTAGVSESFVSQLERGRTSASVATLQRLAAALRIEISDLFAEAQSSEPRVLRRDARQPLEWGHLGRKALLTPKPFHSLEVVSAEFEPGGSTGDEPYTHGDSEELLLVLAGHVELRLGTELFDLDQGDSVNYRSSTPHRVSNPSDVAAEVLFVISPPSY
jgi:transcriptional regulator with XRE-family HTH domain